MRTLCALTVVIFAVSGAVASSPGTNAASPSLLVQTAPPATSQRAINLTEENRHIIREIVLKGSKVTPDKGAMEPRIGEVVRSDVVTYDFPPEVSGKIAALKTYRYFIKDGAVVIVEPSDGKIADVVKASSGN